jgi:DNA polymerase III delta prime subunit
MRSRENSFRDILQVSPERIAALDDVGLNALMADLLRAHAYRCNGATAEVRTNVEVKAGDEGCDGWSPASKIDDAWFGAVPTCWQFKAGTASQPSRLAGEISKPIPKQTLFEGGRFVLVASGSKSGSAGERSRRDAMLKEAAAEELPTDRIEVVGADRLARWCNEHPTVASIWAGRPIGLKRLDAWAQSEVHETSWQSTPETETLLGKLRAQLDLRTGELVHLHIQGPPGVGKTRFALELCRGAAWKDSVIYFSNAADFRLPEILHAAVSEPAVGLIVAADEIQFKQLSILRDALDGSVGRVRLITIGHSDTPDPKRIPSQLINPLGVEQVRSIVSAWYPSMLREYVDFVVQFSDGYIKLARLAADAAACAPSVDARQLLKLRGIKAFLDQMLAGEKREHLYVVAVLASVGWTDDVQGEGEAIANLFGWSWTDVRTTVERFDRKFGIAPRGGRYRYISPKPLAIYLAVEAWETFPDLLKRLPDVLPTEAAKNAYYERLAMIASNPHAKQFSTEQLKLFFSIGHFVDPHSVSRWAALAAANPALASKAIVRALEGHDVERRREIAGEARRTVVWTLVKLAWKSAAFHDATFALALLAEAENETWGNNATGEFRSRFSVSLGGTPVSYVNRLSVIDQVVATGRTALLKLAVSALALVGSRHAHRQEIGSLGDETREPEWRSRPGAEKLECVREAAARLKAIASKSDVDLVAELVTASEKLALLLLPPQTRPLVLDFYEAVRQRHPAAREPIRRVIESIIQREKLYWNELQEDDLRELEQAQNRFEDSSLPARLQQYVGQASFIKAEQSDLKPLAQELLSDASVLSANWGWLTSGEAADGWRLGVTLGELDERGSLEGLLGTLDNRGPDLRLISGYVFARAEKLGSEWFDTWIAAEMRRNPEDFHLLFEIATRVSPTRTSTHVVKAALETRKVEPRLVGQIAYGAWSSISLDVLRDLLTTVVNSGYEETAIAILFQRLKDNPSELGEWDTLATRLATLRKLIHSNHMVNFHWESVARKIAAKHPFEIATAICDAHADREAGWMAEFSGAKEVISELVKIDPSSVWRALKLHLTSKADAILFVTGFPRDVIDQIEADEVIKWIIEEPNERASIIAHLASNDFSSDETLASKVLGQFGNSKTVGEAFFSNFVDGIFWGAASIHWEDLAVQLLAVSKRTCLPQLSRWAQGASVSLQSMAQQDRQREDEEQIRGS